MSGESEDNLSWRERVLKTFEASEGTPRKTMPVVEALMLPFVVLSWPSACHIVVSYFSMKDDRTCSLDKQAAKTMCYK